VVTFKNRVYYHRRTGIIQIRYGRKRTATFTPDKREAAFRVIRHYFGKHLGGEIINDLKRKLA
jgi:hypothetical protein